MGSKSGPAGVTGSPCRGLRPVARLGAAARRPAPVDVPGAWFSLESLTATVGRSRVDGSVGRVVARICRADLIVVDDIGMLPAGQEAAEAFYRIVDAAYERRSVAVTSNLHPSGFDTIMPKTLATATVDRLLHHAHVVLTEGASSRLAEATAGRGGDAPDLTQRHGPQPSAGMEITCPRTGSRGVRPPGDDAVP